jgi:AMMECR1 domain-containing protein
MDELDVIKYGVIVEQGYKRGLLLPNLDGIHTVAEQVSIAKQKAAIESGVFKMYRFQVIRHEVE